MLKAKKGVLSKSTARDLKTLVYVKNPQNMLFYVHVIVMFWLTILSKLLRKWKSVRNYKKFGKVFNLKYKHI